MTKAYSYVRISSLKQSAGDGVRRQMEASRRYAEENGLVLDEQLQDIGLSGFHGHHVATGALGAFLDLVKAGKIPVGSVLIVESLDRLSREDIITAQSQLMTILAANIDVVTLIDGQRYSRDAGIGELVLSLVSMSRAYEESKVKSERVKSAISKRLTDAASGKKTAYATNAPNWITQIKIAGSDFRFELNEHAQSVRRIFDLYNSGVSITSIQRIFNQEKVPTLMKKSRGWAYSPVYSILQNEAVIGTHKIGDQVFENYFPAAITKEVFYAAQDIRARNSVTNRTGRLGKTVTNLFSKIAVCQYCDRAILCKNGGERNNYLYFKCLNSQRGFKCEKPAGRTTIRAAFVEKAVLDNIPIFHLDNRLSQATSIDGLKSQRDEQAKVRDDIKKRAANIRLAIETAESADDRTMFVARLNELRRDIDAAETRLETLEREIREIDETLNSREDINGTIQNEIARWPEMDQEELFLSRSKVSQSVRKIVTQIRVDTVEQKVIVMVGGFTKWWVIDSEGKVESTVDWSGLPFDILVARSKEFFGDKIDVETMRSTYDRLGTTPIDPALWNSEREARGLATV